MENKIIQGDALEELKRLESLSINCVVTSPPYWSKRNYNVDDQLGLEPTFKEYIDKLCNIFDEVKRVLRDDGTCFVNIGDTFIGSGVSRHKGYSDPKNPKKGEIDYDEPSALKQSIPPKCLVQIPSRFAIEMTNRGWILRSEIIWMKPNQFPESCKDRFTMDFEKIFLFTKNKRYYFEQQFESLNKNSDVKYRQKIRKNKNYNSKEHYKKNLPKSFNLNKKNKRSVWVINTVPSLIKHCAMYPERLIEPLIKAGCPEGGTVLDPFFGAGTTGLVALKQNKKFIGIELNKSYCEISRKRLAPNLQQNKIERFI